ncbi:uncharacterized protein LOC129592694 [Paramacrobiotus metropolitanus]|uniref:uncharacterized protein LOC129592694 n=1 Tax=Paramacrobiotus metropolitanus TaxID=2943436 RepID=UPI00244573E3|nr:uncharacterized protein LOC129592694 [Paramacrobiotus metropolitanus]
MLTLEPARFKCLCVGFVMIWLFGIGPNLAVADCPNGWNRNRTSCYYTGQTFTGLTYYDAASFCQSFGPKCHLVEINDMDEYLYIKDTAKSVTWTDGPWIGMVRLTDSQYFMLPSVRRESDDQALNLIMQKLSWNTRQAAYQDVGGFVGGWPVADGYAYGGNCGGMNSNGNYLGFWSCTPSGSPWCEIDLV